MVSDNTFCFITCFSVLLNKRERKETSHTKNHTLVMHLKTPCVQEGMAVRLIFLSHLLKCRASKGDSHHLCAPACLAVQTGTKKFPLATERKEGREGGSQKRRGKYKLLYVVVTGSYQPTQQNFWSLNEVTRNPQNCDRQEQECGAENQLALPPERREAAGAESENMGACWRKHGHSPASAPGTGL